MKKALSYNDVLLVPQYSEITSRSNVNLDVQINDFKFGHPIIPANMKTVAGFDVLKANSTRKGLSILHRFDTLDNQIKLLLELYKYCDIKYLAPSIGIQPEDLESAKKFADIGVQIICIDVAHAHTKMCGIMCNKVSKLFPIVIAGNVATGCGAKFLWDNGATVVKVGVGNGSCCTTRVETGNGVPQLTALMDVANVKDKGYVIADGGISKTGDAAKALCFADMVMIGNMFARTLEAPGEMLTINGLKYKEHVGSSTLKSKHKEGVEAFVQVTGNINDLYNKLFDGIRSCCSYQGVDNLKDLKDSPFFVEISNAGWIESNPHDLNIIK